MKFAILALLGWGAAIKFRPDPSRSPWAIKADPAPKSPITGAFEPWESGSGYYDRVVPDRFSEGSDDLLMRSLITTYALEENRGKSREKEKMVNLTESSS